MRAGVLGANDGIVSVAGIVFARVLIGGPLGLAFTYYVGRLFGSAVG